MLGQRPNPRKNPSSAMGRTLPRPYLVEDKGNGLPLRVILQVIPWNMISEDRKGQRKEWKYLRENCHCCIKCSVPNRAILFSIYNHSQRLWGGADGTNISTMNLNLHMDVGERKEASIKWGAGGNLRVW